MINENHISTADDFRKAADSDRRQSAERVVLPKSGLAMLLCRPSTRWFLFHQRLPMSLAARIENVGAVREPPLPNCGETPSLQKIEEARALAEWVVALVQKTVVAPRLSLDPGPEEISPDWLPQEDVDFIIRYAVGEVVTAGTGDSGLGAGQTSLLPPALSPGSYDLAAFRRERAVAAYRAGGGDVSPVAVGAAQNGPDGFST